MKRDKKIEETFVIRDLETLRVISDPLRYQIYEILISEPLTVKQVADRLGLAPSKLYYHINMLEKFGLIRVVETHLHANLVEKVFQAAANNLDVDKDLLNFSSESGKDNIYTLAAATLDATREDILRSFQARAFELERGAAERPRRAIFHRFTSRLSDEKAEDFHRRLHELIDEFSQADETGGDGDLQTYALTVVFYPSFYYGGEGEDLG